MTGRASVSATIAIAVLAGGARGQSQTATVVPLCPGLTVVTAVSQQDGDYESIKTIESMTDAGVRLKYSSERTVTDLLLDKAKFEKITLYRTILPADLQSATLYEQQFSTELPETIPGATAIGTSRAVIESLHSKGEATIGIFITYTQIKPPIDRNVHPNVYDNQMVKTIKRTSTTPIMVPVIVNDVPTQLPAIAAEGDFFGDVTEFLFLDDPNNPLTLRYRYGVGGIRAVDAEQSKATGIPVHPARDKDVFNVVKITYRCAVPVAESRGGGGGSAPGGSGAGGASGSPAGGAAGGGAGGGEIEHALETSGRVDVYSIYFTFNSDAIREESEPTLKEIADVLRKHADWKLALNGHTDAIGADQYNLDLSKRRAAAVKAALVSRYGVAADRLSTSGFGKSQPKDTNDTVEGRARNRRVELVKGS